MYFGSDVKKIFTSLTRSFAEAFIRASVLVSLNWFDVELLVPLTRLEVCSSEFLISLTWDDVVAGVLFL